MTETYNLYDAKTNLSELVSRAKAGEEIVIARAGIPQARLVPVKAKTEKPKRIPGRLAGKIWVAPDAFSSKVDDEIWASFDDNPICSTKALKRKK